MLSRAADHLFWRARCMKRAVQARSAWGEANGTAARAARRRALGLMEIEDAL